MSILKQKFKLPENFIKIKKDKKVLFLNPNKPDWIVVNKNGAAILRLCNGKRTVENIADSLSIFHGKNSRNEILNFFEKIISTSSFLSTANQQIEQYQPSKLHIVQFSLTDKCNLNCIYCYADDRIKIKNKLVREDWFNLIDNINNIAKNVEIVLTGGEPLLSPYAIELAKYARKLDNQVHLLTNGTLITKNNAKEISESFNLIKLSVDGSIPKIHDFHRGEGSFDKTINAIDLLNKYNATFQIAMTITKKILMTSKL